MTLNIHSIRLVRPVHKLDTRGQKRLTEEQQKRRTELLRQEVEARKGIGA